MLSNSIKKFTSKHVLYSMILIISNDEDFYVEGLRRQKSTVDFVANTKGLVARVMVDMMYVFRLRSHWYLRNVLSTRSGAVLCYVLLTLILLRFLVMLNFLI